MFTCILCGRDDPSPIIRFCTNCGPEAKWLPAETDQPLSIQRYWESVRELKLEPDMDDVSFEEISFRIRARLKVSHRKHCEFVAAISAQQAQSEPLSAFSIEFDENVLDSIAGQDSQLRFRLTNNSQDDLLKFSIDFPDEAVGSRPIAIKTTKFLKPGDKFVVSSTYVFERSGPKEVSGMRVNVIDPAFQSATFIVSPYSFNIGRDTKDSAEARPIEPRWRILRRTLLLNNTAPQTNDSTTDDTTVATTSALSAQPQAVDVPIVTDQKWLTPNELPKNSWSETQTTWFSGLISQPATNMGSADDIKGEHEFTSSNSPDDVEFKRPKELATWMTGLVRGDFEEPRSKVDLELQSKAEFQPPVASNVKNTITKESPWSLEYLIIPNMERRVRDGFEIWSVNGVEGHHEIRIIDPGKFQMGDLSGKWYDEERPIRDISISKSFALATVPVTRSFWKQLMGGSPPKLKNGNRVLSLPATNVSWFDAVAFCNACSRALGLEEAYILKILRGRPGTPHFEGTVEWKGLACQGVRLPTEAEWEYACRAGTTTEFSAGNTEAELHRSGWYANNSDKSCQSVGLKSANLWGLRDMHGNVWEWCNDFFAPYEPCESLDPTGPLQGNSKVARGGAYDSKVRMLRSSSRRDFNPQTREDNLGFRIARSIV